MVCFMEEEEQMEEGSSFLEMLRSGGEEEEEEGHLLCLLTSRNSSRSSSSAYSIAAAAASADDKKPFRTLHGLLLPPHNSTSDSSSTSTSTTKPSKKKVEKKGVATSKKPKTEKVRKEKLGERIMALQQLVSPFGKTDTASVLHEALGYIRFLHDQVQVLSSPYLQRLPSSAHLQDGIVDLRSRGLCLVPVSCIEHVANTNGADLWSPALKH